jgi:hypothetical protein
MPGSRVRVPPFPQQLMGTLATSTHFPFGCPGSESSSVANSRDGVPVQLTPAAACDGLGQRAAGTARWTVVTRDLGFLQEPGVPHKEYRTDEGHDDRTDHSSAGPDA